MQATLVVSKGPALTRAIRLKAGETIIGRSRDCDLCIPSSDISRRHCLISLADGKVSVEDLSSANGTFLNGVRITTLRRVKPGDELRIGPLTFMIEFEATRLDQPAVPSAPPSAAANAKPPRKELAPTMQEIPDVIPLMEEAPATGPTPLPPAKAPVKKAGPVKEPPAAAKGQPEDDDDAVNFDDVAWDLPSGKDFRDILNDMKE